MKRDAGLNLCAPNLVLPHELVETQKNSNYNSNNSNEESKQKH